MTPCQRLRKHITALCDGDLNSQCRKEVEQHLRDCAECRAIFSRVKEMRSCLKDLPTVPASEEFNLLLRERIRRDSMGRRDSSIPVVRVLVPALGAAALLVIMGIGVLDHEKPYPSGMNTLGVSQNPDKELFQFPGQVQYVIEEMPSASGIRLERPVNFRQGSYPDSIPVEPRHSRLRATPVSF